MDQREEILIVQHPQSVRRGELRGKCSQEARKCQSQKRRRSLSSAQRPARWILQEWSLLLRRADMPMSVQLSRALPSWTKEFLCSREPSRCNPFHRKTPKVRMSFQGNSSEGPTSHPQQEWNCWGWKDHISRWRVGRKQ